MFDIDRSNFQDVKVAENKKSASGFNFAANIPIYFRYQTKYSSMVPPSPHCILKVERSRIQKCQNCFLTLTPLQIVSFTSRKNRNVPHQSHYILVKATVGGEGQEIRNAEVSFSSKLHTAEGSTMVPLLLRYTLEAEKLKVRVKVENAKMENSTTNSLIYLK